MDCRMSPMSRPKKGNSSKRRRNVNIFAQVTAKIEPAILRRFNKQEQDCRLRLVSNEAGVEVISQGVEFAFQGTWKAVAQAQAALKNMYVKSVSDAIEDRLSDHIHDDDKVSLRTSKCSVFSGCSNQSRSKIMVGNLTERVAMALERSSSAHSQNLSDDSSKRHSQPESDKDNVALKPRNQNNEPVLPAKRTSLFSNLIHHKKSYIYKCAAQDLAGRSEKENDAESTKHLQMLSKELPELECVLPIAAHDTMSTEHEAGSPTIKIAETLPAPSPVHYEPVYEPVYIPPLYPNGSSVPPRFPNAVVFPRPTYPVDPCFQIPAPVVQRRHPETPVPGFPHRPMQPIQPLDSGYTLETISHETFFYQNRGFIPPTFGIQSFPDLPALPNRPMISPKWETGVLEDAQPQPSHIPSRSPPGEYKCDRCDFVSPYRRNLIHHEKRTHPERLNKCHLCDQSYALKADLDVHLRSHNTKHRCEECGKTYKSHRVLKQHQLTHEESYIKPTFYCQDCGKCFSTKYVLQNHLDNVHNGKQPAFVCQICDKRFTQKHSLLEHQNIHSGLKPFQCDTCQKSFSFRTSLSQHMLLHGSERNYRCNICGKSFLQKNSLRLHSAIHNDNKAHCCSYCGKGFTQKQAMLRHERIHNGEKPYSCEICGRAFNDSSILRRHMHVHRKNQPQPAPAETSTARVKPDKAGVSMITTTAPIVQNAPEAICPSDHLLRIMGESSSVQWSGTPLLPRSAPSTWPIAMDVHPALQTKMIGDPGFGM